jgi:hypothetical protein
MKAWFTKLRISAALDAGRKPSASLRRSINSSGQLQCFEEELAELDQALKQTPSKLPVPPALHRSIMQAVRQAECPHAAPPGLVFLRWVAAPLAVTLALLAVWLSLRGPAVPSSRGTQSLAEATSALELGGQLVQTAPAVVVAPLSCELERLNQDLDNTAHFLLASLP